MVLLATLSSAAFFVEMTRYEWAGEESHYEVVYPAPEYFVEDAETLFPQLKFEATDDIEQKIETYFYSMPERFEPIENYYLVLPQLRMSPEQAQAILFKIQNPCRIVIVEGQRVITAPGDFWEMDEMLSRAYLALGYIPPSILHNSVEWGMIADVKQRSQSVIESHITAIHQELSLIGDLNTS